MKRLTLIFLAFALFASPLWIIRQARGQILPGILASSSSQSFNLVAKSIADAGTCPTSGSTYVCTATITSTGANHLLIVSSVYHGAGQYTIVSVSGGAASYTVCTGCAYYVSGFGARNGVNIAYAYPSTAGATSVIVTMTGIPTINSPVWDVEVREYASVNPPVYNTAGVAGAAGSFPCSSCGGPALTLGGTGNELIYTDYIGNAPTAVASPYSDLVLPGDGTAYADAINTTIGAAPNWTQTSGAYTVSAIAFK